MTAEALQLPELGEVIGEGRFELLQQLGDGGMSTVFVAADRFLGREVALKLLTPRYMGRPEREQRLINEAEYLRRVQGHPNIVELIDAGRLRDRDGWPWLATEILRGEVLARQFIHGKIQIPRVVAIARQIAVALDACHAADIVHRDVTPNNVFILEDQRTIKLFDFSHAGDTRAPKVAAGAPERLTRVFETPGTIGYMSPEQALNAPPHPSMDAFAFGVVLFKLVTGRSPYRQFTDRDDFIKAQRDGTLEQPRLHAWAYDAPEDLAELVHDCTQHDPRTRPTMAEVVARLDALELPSVQDDDATSFFRRPVAAASASREQPEREDPTVGVDSATTVFEPAHVPDDATAPVDPPTLIRPQLRRDDATVPVDPPTMIRPRPPRTAPLEGDWVANQQLARSVAAAGVLNTAAAEDDLPEPEERTSVQLPFARPPHLREEPTIAAAPEPEPETQLAFARPPEHRPPSPIDSAPPAQPTVAQPTVDEPPPTVEASLERAPVINRTLLLRVGGGLLGVLLVFVWFVWQARTRETSERELPTAAEDTKGPSERIDEPEAAPPETDETGPVMQEPVPEIEPIEDPVSPPEIEPKPKHQPKHKPNPPEPEPIKADCEGVEQKARAAEDKEDWRQVASSTARKECWASSKERASLRVRAMYELGNWKECAALGDKADASVQKYVQQCQSLTNQGPP